MALNSHLILMDGKMRQLLLHVTYYLGEGLASCSSQEERKDLLAKVDFNLNTASALYFDMDAELNLIYVVDKIDYMNRLVHYHTEILRLWRELKHVSTPRTANTSSSGSSRGSS